GQGLCQQKRLPHSFSMRMWEELIHFHFMQLMASLSLWEGPSHTCATSLWSRPGRSAHRCLSAITFKTRTVVSHYL
uniref:Uncharacterized protein n=2 Tax=Sus scrofa TaxID=9823 RepID=A0A4X1TNX8_PIG